MVFGFLMSCGSGGGDAPQPDTTTDASPDTTIPPPSGVDTDKDGLSDAAEAVIGTDPTDNDSDDDGLNDGAEFLAGTNPLVVDSDGDGISDGDEVSAGTDPARADTDGDGFTDNAEATAETDPLDRFQWPFDGEQWPNLSGFADGVFGTGWDLGEILSNASFIDQYGNPVDLYQFYNYVILLDFSAGWCMPCREAAKTAEALWVSHRDDGFMIIHLLTEGILNGTDATLDLQQDWAVEYGISFPVVREEENPTYGTLSTRPIYTGSLPFLVLLDRGMKLDSAYGGGQEAAIEARVEALVAQALTQPSEHPQWPGEPTDPLTICDADGDGHQHVSCGGQDCHDRDESITPLAHEYCDEVDHNCDGRMHVDAIDGDTMYWDDDWDGYGDATKDILSCVPRWPYVTNDLDCNDAEDSINPDTIWYIDADKDGYGNPEVSQASCLQPEGYVSNNQDSDDNNKESLGCWDKVVVGRDHTCGLRLDGSIGCWGSNVHGQTASPTEGTFTDIASGYHQVCALRDDGEAVCWGKNTSGSTNPPPGPLLTISCGVEFCCSLTGTTGDNVICWGNNEEGKATAPPGTFLEVSAHGWRHACGIDSDGALQCWGKSEGFQGSPSPTAAPPGEYVSLIMGHFFSNAIKPDGKAIGWGADKYQQSSPPQQFNFVQVSAGTVHACGVTDTGVLKCWGSPSFDRTKCPPGNFKQVDANQLHSCAVTDSGLIECWGFDEFEKTVPGSCI